MQNEELIEQVAYTADLLKSLQASIVRLRHAAEAQCEELDASGGDAVPGGNRQVSKLEGLIRDCQKVERTLVEQSSRFTSLTLPGAGLDLDEARAGFAERISRIRALVSDRLAAGGDAGE